MINHLTFRLIAQQKLHTAYLVLTNASQENSVSKELLDLLYNMPSCDFLRQNFEQPDFPFRSELVNIPKVQQQSQQQ
jgi:hypothetical protein